MFKQIDYVMVYVSDMKRSVQFYRDKLGLPLKFESEHWTEFQTGRTTLALHGGAKLPRVPKGDVAEISDAGTCTIGFTVEDLGETFEQLKGKGVTFMLPPTVREGEGIKLAVFTDPDGLAISLAEMLRKSS